jgi:single-stranded-DNA-specific exonuclease
MKVDKNIAPVEWKMRECDLDIARNLAYETEMPLPIASACVSRGISTLEDFENFCQLEIKKLHNPWTLPDINNVVDRIVSAIKNNEKIFVHGDYDVDGVTATAVVVTAMRKFGADINFHVPHRIYDGYDIKPSSVDRALNAGASLMISVDCGILAFETAEYAKTKKLDLIITDHHTPHENGTVPDCIGVVNPNRHDSEYPFSGLAGVGIAFKVMTALGMKLGFSAKELSEELLEFVALGTVADVAPMIDENRSLVALGCHYLTNTQKAGLKELLRVAGVKNVDTMSIGFSIGPRINAVGRLADSYTALELMLETSARRAKFLAEQLNTANSRRQAQQEQAIQEAFELIPKDIENHSILLIAAKGWHPGLVGLIAGKIAEQYGKPTLVCTIKDDGTVRGSARSAEEFNIIEAIKSPECNHLFTKSGGHPFAAGFDFPEGNIDELRQQLNNFAKRKTNGKGIRGVKTIYIDSRIQPGEINESFYKSLCKLAPFGSENPEPIFMTKNMSVIKVDTIGAEGKHLKIRLKGGKDTDPWIDAVAWRRGHESNIFCEGAKVDVAFKLSKSEWQGRVALSLTIEDLKLSG